MPLIQIEQDSPELIAQVNREIEHMAVRIRTHSGTVIVPMAEEYVLGYLSALYQHSLLSDEQWQRLRAEAVGRFADAVGLRGFTVEL
ncbi:hypothetical protein [Pseudomonas sp. PSPC3-3]|uniref:hypothetical protein n=1 Tax=unclassified Pseudomonas TaxID=196821 RepID=UPI003CEF828A